MGLGPPAVRPGDGHVWLTQTLQARLGRQLKPHSVSEMRMYGARDQPPCAETPSGGTITTMSGMRGTKPDKLEASLLRLMQPDEELDFELRLSQATVILTDRLLVVLTGNRVTLDVPYRALRRVELDMERRGLATLAIVPDSPADRPQVLTVPGAECEHAAFAVARICERLGRT